MSFIVCISSSSWTGWSAEALLLLPQTVCMQTGIPDPHPLHLRLPHTTRTHNPHPLHLSLLSNSSIWECFQCAQMFTSCTVAQEQKNKTAPMCECEYSRVTFWCYLGDVKCVGRLIHWQVLILGTILLPLDYNNTLLPIPGEKSHS